MRWVAHKSNKYINKTLFLQQLNYIFCIHEIRRGPRKLLTIPLLSFLFFGHACHCKAGQMVTNAFSVSWLRPDAYRRGAGGVKNDWGEKGKSHAYA